MQVGDLVRDKSCTCNRGQYGIIVNRRWRGVVKVWLVEWMNGVRSIYDESRLEAVCK